MKQVIIGFGIIITALLILSRLARIAFIDRSPSFEYILAGFGILSLLIGFLLRKKFSPASQPLPVAEAVPVIFTRNDSELKKIGLSNRELEILQHISEGLSNLQIAETLFVSENTIKKHISNLFIKMDVARRTEAVKKAKDLGLIE